MHIFIEGDSVVLDQDSMGKAKTGIVIGSSQYVTTIQTDKGEIIWESTEKFLPSHIYNSPLMKALM